MSLTTIGKNGRVYVRAFDHEEAKRRYEEGESVSALAREYGVTYYAVYRVVIPGVREREYAQYVARYHSGTCPDCGAQATLSTYQHRCRSCALALRATSVRETELRCFRCGEWKPDEEFYLGPASGKPLVRRRGRKHECRACNNRARQEYRERHKVPCVGCGAPALPQSEKGTAGGAEPRCRECFYEWQRLPEQRAAARERSRAARIQAGSEAPVKPAIGAESSGPR